MALEATTRTYQMSDADLIQRASQLLSAVQRDSTAFSARNIAADEIAGCRQAREAFAEFPTDEELQGEVSAATDAKNNTRRDLEVSIRALRSMAQLRYDGKGLYHTFGFEDLTRQSDNSLHRTARRVSRVANRLESELSGQGLTAAALQGLDSLCGRFDLAIETLSSAIETRDIQTQHRIRLGNDLYGKLARLAAVGKSLFVDHDEARYNDYVLRDTHAQPAQPVPDKIR